MTFIARDPVCPLAGTTRAVKPRYVHFFNIASTRIRVRLELMCATLDTVGGGAEECRELAGVDV